jgi:hypothetical protein
LLALTGAAGLLLSFSRAGTALGVAAIAGTAAVVLRATRVKRLALIVWSLRSLPFRCSIWAPAGSQPASPPQATISRRRADAWTSRVTRSG